ncbi:MAG TPA: hypothetical protein ENH40_06070 [Nitrospirae bacterium]|nr:hypothetical protein BMS3Bbin08_00058 [bacterium BMS3Bbin08]HDZ62692.1 hypothetical protein [Nitrospirota bacterium]
MLNIEIVGIERIQRELDPKIFKKAFVAALNTTAKQCMAAVDKQIRAEFTLKQKDVLVKKGSAYGFKFKKANYSTLTATIEARGSKFPLISFSAKQTKKGVTVQVKKSGARKLIPGAFIANMAYGKGVFKRKTTKRLPTKELKMISIAKLLTRQKSLDVITKTLDSNLQKNYNSAILFYMSKVKK